MITWLSACTAALIDFIMLLCSQTSCIQSDINITSNFLFGSSPKNKPSAVKLTLFIFALWIILCMICSSGKSVACTCAPSLAAMIDGSAAPAPNSITVLSCKSSF